MTEPRKSCKWILFGLVFFLSLFYAAKCHIDWYPYDSQYYWTTSDPVFSNGFDITCFPETFRGYFFIMLLGLFKHIMPGVFGWHFFSSLLIAVCFSFCLPLLVKGRHIETIVDIIRTLIAYGIFMYFWKMFMQYPLSDFPAAFFMIGGAVFLKTISEDRSVLQVLLVAFASGIFFYAAYNTRVVNLYGIFCLIVVFVILNRKRMKTIIISLIAMMIGIIVIALPQCFINKQYVGAFSPRVYSEQYFDYQTGLQNQQLFWGVEYDRYETYIGDPELYPDAKVFYVDPVGKEILDREGMTVDQFGIKSILYLMKKYPADMIGIYARHLISIMTPSNQKEYIEGLYHDKGGLVSLSIVIWMIAILSIANQIKNRTIDYKKLVFIIAICIPSLLEIAGAVEVRFFLPIFLIAYYYVFAVIDYKALVMSLKGKIVWVLILMMIVFALWISIFGNIMANNQERVFMINDYYTEWGGTS